MKKRWKSKVENSRWDRAAKNNCWKRPVEKAEGCGLSGMAPDCAESGPVPKSERKCGDV